MQLTERTVGYSSWKTAPWPSELLMSCHHEADMSRVTSSTVQDYQAQLSDRPRLWLPHRGKENCVEPGHPPVLPCIPSVLARAYPGTPGKTQLTGIWVTPVVNKICVPEVVAGRESQCYRRKLASKSEFYGWLQKLELKQLCAMACQCFLPHPPSALHSHL